MRSWRLENEGRILELVTDHFFFRSRPFRASVIPRVSVIGRCSMLLLAPRWGY